MTRDEAMAFMELTVVNEVTVNSAFRRMSVTCHPDSQAPDPEKWAKLVQAKAILSAPPPRCTLCKGTGRVQMGRLSKFCADCGGTGHL